MSEILGWPRWLAAADALTACAAPRYGDHDYSQPPHNTPDDPRDAEDETPCQAICATPPLRCEHERRYELIVYQPGSHDWIRLFACTACTASLRDRNRRMPLGPRFRGDEGIARIRSVLS